MHPVTTAGCRRMMAAYRRSALDQRSKSAAAISKTTRDRPSIARAQNASYRAHCTTPRAGLTTLLAATRVQVLNKTIPRRPRWAAIPALVAITFGIVTIIVGGKTLFAGAEERAAIGNIVPFVLWFNFAAGFAYVIAGFGLFLWKRWAAQLSAAIAVATIALFIAFVIYIFLGGMFEVRTVGAMIIRSVVWIVIAASACRAIRCFQRGTRSTA